MARLRSTKKVACLEGDWDGWAGKSSVLPILQMIESRESGFHYVHRRLSTVEELQANLDRVGRAPSYQLVYLAFHGTPGAVTVGDHDVTLEDLAEMMGDRFVDRVIHFGSCSTLKCTSERLDTFLDATRATAITGYKRNVGWMESAAFELLYYSAWTGYVNPASFRSRMLKDYSQLADRLGFACHFRE